MKDHNNDDDQKENEKFQKASWNTWNDVINDRDFKIVVLKWM